MAEEADVSFVGSSAAAPKRLEKEAPVYTGMFAALNNVYKKEEGAPQGTFVPVVNLPDSARKAVLENEINPFVQRLGGAESILFGPIKFFSKSPEFSAESTIGDGAMKLLQRGGHAFVFCVHDSSSSSPFWPSRFSISINDTHYKAPEDNPSSASYFFWMDVTAALRGDRTKIHIYANRAVSGTPYFVVAMALHPTTNAELLSSIEKHTELENWQRLFKLSDPGDGVISESFLTIPLCCPLSQGRIANPVRGEQCEHLSCFDAEAYFKFQRLVGTWKCPICGKDAPLQKLYIDDVFASILRYTSHDLDSLKVGYKGTT